MFHCGHLRIQSLQSAILLPSVFQSVPLVNNIPQPDFGGSKRDIFHTIKMNVNKSTRNSYNIGNK